ncbi:MAG: TonB family protein [Deltaproteobacteria bacterium]|nr:TonB family protein [Deltaproteobacteria bacterium]
MAPLLSGLSAFFSWLMDYTIDISILICLIFLIRLITSKKLPAWWHYNLWIILLLRMVIPLKFNNPFNIPSVVPISIDDRLFESILIEDNFIITKISSGLSSNQEGFNIQVNDVMLLIWITGTIFFGIYILVKNIKFRNILKKEPLMTEKRVLCLFEECKQRMKTKTLLQITVTNKIKTPALYGYIHPRLLLPARVAEKLSHAELTYIFMHELGHLKRHDIGVAWIFTFLHILQWFNPLVWLAFYQMRIDQESACDSAVLSRINNNQTIDYANTIISFLESFCKSRKLPALVGILESQTQIKKRITMIISYRRGSKWMMSLSTASLVFIGFILFTITGVQNRDNIIQDKLIEEPVNAVVEPANESLLTEITEVKILADNKNISVTAQDQLLKYEAVQEEISRAIQTPLAEIQMDNIKDEIDSANPANGTQKSDHEDKIANIRPDTDIQEVLSTTQIDNTKNEEMIQSSAIVLKESKDAYDTYPENTNIQEDSASALYENRENSQTAQLTENGRNDSAKYLGLASVVYLIPEKLDLLEETPAISESRSEGIKIFNLKEVDEQPKIVSYYRPRYPFEAKERGIEGRVLLRFTVDKAGNVIDPQVVSAEPKGIFEQAALDSVTKYRLKPAVKDGKSVNTIVKLPINFTMNENFLRFAQR